MNSIRPDMQQKIARQARLGLLVFVVALAAFFFNPRENGLDSAYAMQSDLNHDGEVNLEDVKLFSTRKLKMDSIAEK